MKGLIRLTNVRALIQAPPSHLNGITRHCNNAEKMHEQHTSLTNAQPDFDIELGSMRRVTSFHIPQDTDSAYNSARSSLDESYYEKHHCDVHIHDDVSVNSGANPHDVDEQPEATSRQSPSDRTRIFPISSGARLTNLPDRLVTQLKVLISFLFKDCYFINVPKIRDPMRSRWMYVLASILRL